MIPQAWGWCKVDPNRQPTEGDVEITFSLIPNLVCAYLNLNKKVIYLFYFFIFYTRHRSTISTTLPHRAYSFIYICARHSFTYIYKEMRMRVKMIILFKKIFFYFLHSTALNDKHYPPLKGIFIHLYMC